MKHTLHLIADDLHPVHCQLARNQWEFTAAIEVRCGFADLLANHAEAARVYDALYPNADH